MDKFLTNNVWLLATVPENEGFSRQKSAKLVFCLENGKLTVLISRWILRIHPSAEPEPTEEFVCQIMLVLKKISGLNMVLPLAFKAQFMACTYCN